MGVPRILVTGILVQIVSLLEHWFWELVSAGVSRHNHEYSSGGWPHQCALFREDAFMCLMCGIIYKTSHQKLTLLTSVYSIIQCQFLFVVHKRPL